MVEEGLRGAKHLPIPGRGFSRKFSFARTQLHALRRTDTPASQPRNRVSYNVVCNESLADKFVLASGLSLQADPLLRTISLRFPGPDWTALLIPQSDTSMLVSAPGGFTAAMELTQLEFFLMVVEEGSFSKAAVRVFRTQPAVSIAIRRLEEEIGAPLFDARKKPQPSQTPASLSMITRSESCHCVTTRRT